ncbi:BREX system serine/threonine kinase PglW, partial [Streptomyces sp. NPDC058953]
TVPPGAVDWDERRLVELAAAASVNAAATPRLEIYPRDLSLVRALRLTQAGLVRWVPGMPEGQQPGLTGEAVHERVRARFPEMVVPDGRGGTHHELPTGGPLTKALRDAGFELSLSTHEREGVLRYLPTRVDDASSYLTTGAWRQSTRTGAVTRYTDDPQLAGAIRAEERLLASARRDGFRVLTVRQQRVRDALRELDAGRLGTAAVSVTELFLEALRAQITPGTKPTWETLLRADAAEPGSKGAVRFAEYARTAWGAVEPRITELLRGGGDGAGPVLLTEAGVFARYDAMGVLDRLASAARQGGRGLWLLVPQSDPSREPRLGQVAVPYQAGLGEWIQLPDTWVGNAHRGSGDVVASAAVEGDAK